MTSINPAPVTLGDEWFVLNSTSATYPTTGIGGATTTHGSSQVLANRQAVITGLMLVTAGTATTVTLVSWATGSAVDGDTFPIPATGNEGITQPWGLNGASVYGDFGVRLTSGTGTVKIFYQRYF